MSDYLIIGDNDAVPEDATLHFKGQLPRDFAKVPLGSIPEASVFGLPLIDEAEWPERIRDMANEQSRLSDIIKSSGMAALNQGQTNFCWANGPVNAVRAIRTVQNQGYIGLSPASVACLINNFRNEGGWGTEALKWIVSNGIVPTDLWPANAINRQYFTAEAKETALKYRVQEWWDLTPRSMKELATCLLMRIPVAIGLNWWRHEVMAVDLVDKDSILIWNSWGDDWPSSGAGGFSVLRGYKALPDDAVAPRVTTAS
jgi:hypothetical protein